MGLLIIAMALFIGMIVCWVVLPSSPAVVQSDREVVAHPTVEQLA
jgi:hypothetical protein